MGDYMLDSESVPEHHIAHITHHKAQEGHTNPAAIKVKAPACEYSWRLHSGLQVCWLQKSYGPVGKHRILSLPDQTDIQWDQDYAQEAPGEVDRKSVV